MEYKDLALEVVSVSIVATIVASVIGMLFGVFSNYGVIGLIADWLVLLGMFVYATKNYQSQNVLEDATIILLSAVTIYLLGQVFSMIPQSILAFNWQSIATLVASVYMSDSLIKKYLKR